MDVYGASLAYKDLSWWENDGTGTQWTRHIVCGSLYNPGWAQARDIDDDGDLDILAVSDEYSYVAWWENPNGSGEGWTAHIIATWYQFPGSVDSTDFDQDGDMDVVGTSYVHGLVTLWENMDGMGTTWEESQIASISSVRGATACDIDLDGDIDVSVHSYLQDELIWLENMDGTGNQWGHHSCADYTAPEVLTICDINDDGTPDLLSRPLYFLCLACSQIQAPCLVRKNYYHYPPFEGRLTS